MQAVRKKMHTFAGRHASGGCRRQRTKHFSDKMKKLITLSIILLLCVCSLPAQTYRRSVSILGDSYSTFRSYLEPDTNEVWYPQETAARNDVQRVEQTWWHLLLKDYGLRLCKNNSYSGSTVSTTGYRKEDYTQRAFITRMDNLGCPDLILIFGATNDSWAGSPVGEYKYADWTKEDLKQFRPAMAYMLDYMTRRYVNVDICFILNSELKDTIDESVRTLCAHYGVDLLELHDIDKQAGHPSVEGMKAIAEQVARHLKLKKTK